MCVVLGPIRAATESPKWAAYYIGFRAASWAYRPAMAGPQTIRDKRMDN